MSPAPSPRTDLLGRPLSEVEQRLVASYEGLKALLEQDLPPAAAANVREALASMWQVMNDLALLSDRPDV
ncbi:MAG: hypothetical protein ACKOCB_03005 [Planctomycetia bacterium]